MAIPKHTPPPAPPSTPTPANNADPKKVRIPPAVYHLASAIAAFNRAGMTATAKVFQIYIVALGTGPIWEDPTVDVALERASRELPCRRHVPGRDRIDFDKGYAKACLQEVIKTVRDEERGCRTLLEEDWEKFLRGEIGEGC